MKMYEMNHFSLFCKSYLIVFSTFIIGATILCCATTYLGIFGTVIGIFGVAFVRALADRLPVFQRKNTDRIWWSCYVVLDYQFYNSWTMAAVWTPGWSR